MRTVVEDGQDRPSQEGGAHDRDYSLIFEGQRGPDRGKDHKVASGFEHSVNLQEPLSHRDCPDPMPAPFAGHHVK